MLANYQFLVKDLKIIIHDDFKLNVSSKKRLNENRQSPLVSRNTNGRLTGQETVCR